MSIRVIALCAVALFAFVSTAEAKHHRHHYKHHVRHHSVYHAVVRVRPHRSAARQPVLIVCDRFGCHNANPKNNTIVDRVVRHVHDTLAHIEEHIVPHPEGCPRTAFCGCGTSLHVFGKRIRELYLAANWGRFPRTSPAPGMVAYRSHHVFAIERVNNDGSVLAYDPNSGGHKTRVHTVSLRGFRVVNPHGGKVAMN
ncbi:MAG: hypothetical protein KGL39_38325 [Patescibacteria group bacterium]|nr:hypothetical protein [Patescibacteria group bacterium]